jgi:hypothetical protein
MDNKEQICIYCEQGSDRAPLIPFVYQGNNYWICPQHLPILIHKPEKLANKLPGTDKLQPPEGHAH